MESDVTLVFPCVCVCVYRGRFYSFIPLSQHMGKGLQPLVAMETHVCPSLCLSVPRTDRQLAASQPRITHTHKLLLCRSYINKHTELLTQRWESFHITQTLTHTHATHTHTLSVSMVEIFVSNFCQQLLQPTVSSRGRNQKGQCSALLTLCKECEDATENKRGIK